MKKINTKALVEGAVLISIAAALMIITQYIPFIALFGIILWPMPITILTFKYDFKISFLGLIALFLITAVFIDPISTLSIIILYGIPAIVLGSCLKKRYTPFTSVIVVSLSMFISYIVIIKLSVLVLGVDVMEQLKRLIDQAVLESKQLLLEFGYNEQEITQLPALQSINSNTLMMVFPGILALVSLIGSYINYYFISIVFRKLRIKINELLPIDQWYINNGLSFGIFFSIIIAWLMIYFNVNNAEIVFNSIYIIFDFIFQIQGIAVIAWFLKIRGVSHKLIVALIILIMLTPVSRLAFLLGMADYVIDFRRINPFRRGRIPPGE